MQTVDALILAIPTLVAIVSIVGFAISRGKDKKDEGKREGTLETLIKQNSANTNSIIVKIDKLDGKQDLIIERIVAVEESAKSAHKRIDEIIKH
ncbi:MAG: hypothetical protein RR327_06875 [Clostridia bacterium]